MSVYCYRCGQRLAGGARRCPNCGSSIFYDESGLREDFIKRGTAETPVMDENAAQAYSDHKDYEGTYENGSGSAAGDPGSSPYREPYESSSGADPYGNTNGNSYGSSFHPYGNGAYNNAPFGSAARSASAAPVVQTKRDVIAKWAMLCGIGGLIMTVFPLAGLPLSIAALVMGIMGLKAEHRKGRAIAGMIMGIAGFLMNAAILALAIYIVAHPELQSQLEQMANDSNSLFSYFLR
nr:hypothetical protein [Lachnospiraceae bacterium]